MLTRQVCALILKAASVFTQTLSGSRAFRTCCAQVYRDIWRWKPKLILDKLLSTNDY